MVGTKHRMSDATINVPGWHLDPAPTPEEAASAIAERDAALSGWRQAGATFEHAHPQPPVKWGNHEQARAWERARDEARSEATERLDRARTRVRRHICLAKTSEHTIKRAKAGDR